MNKSDQRPRLTSDRLRLAQLGLGLAMSLAFAGCQTPAAPFDPFMAGRTTIPPPGTAAPAAAAPYYEGSPPVVTVPDATTVYPPPGVTTAPVPTSALPPAASPRFLRGQTVPQARTGKVPGPAQLAGWQAAGVSRLDNASTSAADAQPEAEATSGVVRALHETPSREPPLRIMTPASDSKQ